jgi:hypothetical protein
MAIEITQDEIKQMGIYLLGLREKERELLDQLEEVRQQIGRQEGGIQYARAKLGPASAANEKLPPRENEN